MRGWVFCVFLLPLSAMAADDHQQARSLFQAMHYSQAYQAARQVIESSEAGPPELVEAYFVQGLSLSALGKVDEALDAFRRLLSIQPGFKPSSDLSPKLTGVFYQAVARSADQLPISLSHQQAAIAEIGGEINVQVTLVADPLRMVHKIRLMLRSAEASFGQQVQVEVSGPGPVALKIPADKDRDQIQYLFEALNAHGGVLARTGSQQTPFALKRAPKELVVPEAKIPVADTILPGPTPPPPESSGIYPSAWYQTWWFWTAVGVVVAGATTTTALVLIGDDSLPARMDYQVGYGLR